MAKINKEKQKRINSINYYLKKFGKDNELDVERLTQGKELSSFTTKKGYESFIKRAKRLQEQPKIKKEIEKFEKKRLIKDINKEVGKQFKQADFTDSEKNALNFSKELSKLPHMQDFRNMNAKELKKAKQEIKSMSNIRRIVDNYTKEEVRDFLGTYFQQIELYPSVQRRLDNIIESIEGQLDVFQDIVRDITTKEQFKEYPSKYTRSRDINQIMKSRLDKFESLLSTEYSDRINFKLLDE